MKSNLLLTKIYLIQKEYKQLLTTLLPKIKSGYIPEALDEVNIFWLRHIEEVQLYLIAWFSGENSYVFTSTSAMDFEDNEHLPFLLMGNKHIIDDPLSKYSEVRVVMPEGRDADFLYVQSVIAAEKNLMLIENLREEVLILPLRLINQLNECASLYSVGERVFTSLFNGINSLDDYFSKCSSFEDIMCFARKDIGKLVIFSEDDDLSQPFDERFKIALANTQYVVDVNKPDSFNFLALIFGFIQQAISVIATCIDYGCIPYVRYPVAHHYISLLSDSMSDIQCIATLRYKMNVAFVVYQLCDRNNLSKVCLKDFIAKNHEYGFSQKLFQDLAEHGVNEKNFFKKNISQYVNDELELFYNTLSVTNDTVKAST